jgi:hypothetical protein
LPSEVVAGRHLDSCRPAEWLFLLLLLLLLVVVVVVLLLLVVMIVLRLLLLLWKAVKCGQRHAVHAVVVLLQGYTMIHIQHSTRCCCCCSHRPSYNAL